MATSNNNSALLWTLAGAGTLLAVRLMQRQQRKIDFREKVVVVTGGSRGLGLVMARQLAQQGAYVAICARDEQELTLAEADLKQYSPNVLTHPCDLTDRAQVDAFIDVVRGSLGPVDVLINNAGTIIVSPYEHTTEEDFRDAMEANFWAAYYTTNAVLPDMRGRRAGRIVNVASFGGKISVPHLLPYSTSKFALVGYSEGLRAELLKDGVYVTTICPGLVRTGSPRNAIFKGQNQKEYAWFKIGDSLPGLSVSAEYCAENILNACRYGEAERIISLPAKLGAAIHGLFPGLTADALSLVNGLLPAPGGIAEQRAKGRDSESAWSQSVLTTLTEQAADANNERVATT